MVKCDNETCETKWYHAKCVGLLILPSMDEPWFCRDCSMEKTLATANDELRKSKETVDLTIDTGAPKVSFAEAPSIKPIPKEARPKQPAAPKQKNRKSKKQKPIKLCVSFHDGDSLLSRNNKKRKLARISK